MARTPKLMIEVEKLETWLAAENAFIEAVSERQRLLGHGGAYFEASDRVFERLRALFDARSPIDVAVRLVQREPRP